MTGFAIFAFDGAQRNAVEGFARSAGILIDTTANRVVLDRLLARGDVDLVIAAWIAEADLGGLMHRYRRSAFIVLAGPDDVEDAIVAGAQAVLPLSASPSDLRLAVAAVSSGLALVPHAGLAALFDAESITRDDDATEPLPSLTPREMEVLASMTDGASNKLIARRLGISFHTVKFHVAAILAKLDAETRTEAIACAARLGLVML
jgi:DNA-binding NarL/FixJ family response regulator